VVRFVVVVAAAGIAAADGGGDVGVEQVCVAKNSSYSSGSVITSSKSAPKATIARLVTAAPVAHQSVVTEPLL